MNQTLTPPSRRGLLQRIRHLLSYPVRLRQRIDSIPHLQGELARMQGELARQQGELATLARDHRASVEWLHTVYPEIVAAMARKIEQPQLDALSTTLFAALHRELAARPSATAHPAPAPSEALPQAPSADPAFYIDLERNFRGTEAEIRERMQPYLALIREQAAQRTPVLDIGCGRGEWLSVLREAGLAASGVDLNPINGSHCRGKGLDVVTGDAVGHLAGLPEASLGAVTAFHLVEHLPFERLQALTDAILRALKPGGLLIYETPNPENLLVATRDFWLDPTHQRPLPPALLEFFVVQRGFEHVDTLRLHPGADIDTPDPALKALLGGPRDYAVIARKPLARP
jgi:SAM-dependent methyltransferase